MKDYYNSTTDSARSCSQTTSRLSDESLSAFCSDAPFLLDGEYEPFAPLMRSVTGDCWSSAYHPPVLESHSLGLDLGIE